MRHRVAALAISAAGFPAITSAQTVMNHDYVMVRDISNSARWYLSPWRGRLELGIADPKESNDQTFYIEKVDPTNGPAIRIGDQVRIRGINKDYFDGRDPWLQMRPDAKRMNATTKHPEWGDRDPTILTIDPDYSVPPGSIAGELHYGDRFTLGGLDGTHLCLCVDTALKIYVASVTTAPGFDSDFFFDKPTPAMLVDNITKRGPPPPLSPPKPPPCYFCTAARPQPGSSGESGSGEQTVRTQIVGSGLFIWMSNTGSRPYTCTLSFSWGYDSAGDHYTHRENVTVPLAANASEVQAFKTEGAYANLRFDDGITKQCNAS